jgi:hypothetical protein
VDFTIQQKVREERNKAKYKSTQKVNKMNSIAHMAASLIGIFT